MTFNFKVVLVAHESEVLAEGHYEVLDVLNDTLLNHPFIDFLRIFYVYEVEQILILERLLSLALKIIVADSVVEVGLPDGALLVVKIFCYVVFEGVFSPTPMGTLADVEKPLVKVFDL